MHTPTSPIRPRIIADIILFFAVLYAPWWVMGVAVFLCILYFKDFYEAFFIGFLFDVLYGANFSVVYGFRFFFSLVFLILIFAVRFLKGKVRM